MLGVPLEEDPAALAYVEASARAVAARRHLDFDETFALARRQARLPAGSTPVPPAGVAPGIAAAHGPTRIFAYPGVPYEFQQDVAGDGREPSTTRGSFRMSSCA